MKDGIYPLCFDPRHPGCAASVYLQDPAIAKLAAFFLQKGLQQLKEEDRQEGWYQDWIDYQAEHRLYAALLSPKELSGRGTELDLLNLTRFIESFAYFSPAHGYSLQVSFLGIFPILMSKNQALRKEAVEILEKGGLFAFGVSERDHGSDLYGNTFLIAETSPGQYVGNGSKYYIGNANAASMISVLAMKGATGRKRKPFAFFALRPDKTPRPWKPRKIRTLGVRTAFVGEFDVEGYPFPAEDMVAEGRDAWDAVFGTVALGKFFLGFGSIGIGEHAFHEALAHARGRTLYGKPAVEMPHLRTQFAHAYAKITAMKLYAYRSVDYLQLASAEDRRYLLWNAVQKAKVSTEGVGAVHSLSELIGAKAFESDTYFEQALRDIQLIPNLEGSVHINLGLAAQFLERYFRKPAKGLPSPPSLLRGDVPSAENPYLFQARTASVKGVRFAPFLQAYGPFKNVPNVRVFMGQARAFRFLMPTLARATNGKEDAEVGLGLAKCFSTIVYGQLIAENAMLLGVPRALVSVIFHQLIEDLSLGAVRLGSLAQVGRIQKLLIKLVIKSPKTEKSDLTAVGDMMSAEFSEPDPKRPEPAHQER